MARYMGSKYELLISDAFRADSFSEHLFDLHPDFKMENPKKICSGGLLWLNLFAGNEMKHENMTEQMNSVLSKLDVRNKLLILKMKISSEASLSQIV